MVEVIELTVSAVSFGVSETAVGGTRPEEGAMVDGKPFVEGRFHVVFFVDTQYEEGKRRVAGKWEKRLPSGDGGLAVVGFYTLEDGRIPLSDMPKVVREAVVDKIQFLLAPATQASLAKASVDKIII